MAETMTDFAAEREAMVDRQLKRRGITEQSILDAFLEVPREAFVSAEYAHRAYGDHPLPIGEEQTISQPFIVGLMSSLLELTGREKVLEVGTGSGYQTAVLAALARRVCSIERRPRLAERARATLEALGYDNVWVRVGNGTLGWPDQAPFDRIIVTAAAVKAPPALIEQLKLGGRMIIPLGETRDAQQLVQIDKTEAGLTEKNLLPVRFVPLVQGRAGVAARMAKGPRAAEP